MTYTIENAKSIFELIQSVSWYAIPFIVSLLFPFFWLVLVKLIGFDKPEKYNGFVIATCVALFLSGICVLKWGQGEKDKIRQNLIILQKYYQRGRYLTVNIKSIIDQTTLNKGEILDVMNEYPSHFISDRERIYATDTVYIKSYCESIAPLIDQYIMGQFAKKTDVCFERLFAQGDNVRNNFLPDCVYYYFAIPENKKRYYFYISSNNLTMISRSDSSKLF